MDRSSLLPVLTAVAVSPQWELLRANQGQFAVRSGAGKLVPGGRLFDRRPEVNQALAGGNAVLLSHFDAHLESRAACGGCIPTWWTNRPLSPGARRRRCPSRSRNLSRPGIRDPELQI
jgi:hypothetical protein